MIAIDIMELVKDPIVTTIEEMIQLACQINANSFALDNPNESVGNEIGVSFLPISALFNHSCSPNAVAITDKSGNNVVRTVQPVKKGHDLCISYIDVYLPIQERRGKLLETKHFWCECDRCVENQLDYHIEGLKCPQCPQGYISQTLQNTYTCRSCGYNQNESDFIHFQKNLEKDYEAAFEFVRIRNFENAKTAFEQFLSHYTSLVHPLHFHLFNALPPLVNACTQLQDFPKAIDYLEMIIHKMDTADFIPLNWPEKAAFLFRLGELNEIYLLAIQQNIYSGDSITFKKNAIDAYTRSFEIRHIAYGKEHPTVKESMESISRLENLQ